MLKLPKKIVLGTIVGSLLLMGTAFGAVKVYEKNIKARFASIKLVVNDTWIETKAEPFIYNGNVYAPVATIANALGVEQKWINEDKDWMGAVTPSVRFNGKTIGAVNEKVSKLQSSVLSGKPAPEAYSVHPLGGQLYIGESIHITAGGNDLVLIDYSKKDGESTTSIPRVVAKGTQGYNQHIIPGSLSMIDNKPNNIRFTVWDRIPTEKYVPNGQSWVTTFEYKDGELTKIRSAQIEHGKAWVGAVTATGNVLHVEYRKGDYFGKHELAGLVTFKFENGKLTKLEELFK